MKHFIAISILSILFSCKSKPKPNLIKAEQKTSTPKLDTMEGLEHDLKNGYATYVLTDSNYYYLFLQKDTIRKIISTTEAYHHINTLGWEEADFDSSFVLVSKYGGGFPGNPKPCELIEKATGKNLLIQNGAFFIDADEKHQVLLYCENDVPDISDSIIWKDVKNNIVKKYAFPKDIFGEAGVLNRLSINKIEKDFFELFYIVNHKDKKIRYRY